MAHSYQKLIYKYKEVVSIVTLVGMATAWSEHAKVLRRLVAMPYWKLLKHFFECHKNGIQSQ